MIRRSASVCLLASTLLLAGTPAQAGSGATVRLIDDAISPGTTTVSRGARVTFRWAGKSPHDLVVSRNGKRVWRVGLRTSGAKSRVFKTAGTYKLLCTVHAPDMRGTLRVR